MFEFPIERATQSKAQVDRPQEMKDRRGGFGGGDRGGFSGGDRGGRGGFRERGEGEERY